MLIEPRTRGPGQGSRTCLPLAEPATSRVEELEKSFFFMGLAHRRESGNHKRDKSPAGEFLQLPPGAGKRMFRASQRKPP